LDGRVPDPTARTGQQQRLARGRLGHPGGPSRVAAEATLAGLSARKRAAKAACKRIHDPLTPISSSFVEFAEIRLRLRRAAPAGGDDDGGVQSNGGGGSRGAPVGGTGGGANRLRHARRNRRRTRAPWRGAPLGGPRERTRH